MKNLLRVFFLKIQIYPQTSIEQKYGAFYLKNKDTLISFTSPTELKSSSPLKRPKFIFTDLALLANSVIKLQCLYVVCVCACAHGCSFIQGLHPSASLSENGGFGPPPLPHQRPLNHHHKKSFVSRSRSRLGPECGSHEKETLEVSHLSCWMAPLGTLLARLLQSHHHCHFHGAAVAPNYAVSL